MILGKNEGTVVDKGEKPRTALAVLPAPALAGPADERHGLRRPRRSFRWAPVDGSAGYWLEISSDQNFERIVENAFGIAGTAHAAKPLAAGDYFWRVSALDGFGLPGERSETWRFRVTPDDTRALPPDRPPGARCDLPRGLDRRLGRERARGGSHRQRRHDRGRRGRRLPRDHRGDAGREHADDHGDRRGRQRHHRRAPFRLHARRGLGGRL